MLKLETFQSFSSSLNKELACYFAKIYVYFSVENLRLLLVQLQRQMSPESFLAVHCLVLYLGQLVKEMVCRCTVLYVLLNVLYCIGGMMMVIIW